LNLENRRKTLYIDSNSLAKKEICDGVFIRVAWGKQIMMSYVDLDPNSTVPRHSHPNEQMGMVLKGKFELTIADETRLLREGDAFLIPSGVEHSVKVLESNACALDIFSPPREDYK
jgi:quercetin dioxygenase-like cupin family protein